MSFPGSLGAGSCSSSAHRAMSSVTAMRTSISSNTSAACATSCPCEVDDLLEACATPQDKLLCASEPEYLQERWRSMAEPFDGRLSAMFTADFYFEFMAPGVDKGRALAGALPKLGIDASEVVAFVTGKTTCP